MVAYHKKTHIDRFSSFKLKITNKTMMAYQKKTHIDRFSSFKLKITIKTMMATYILLDWI